MEELIHRGYKMKLFDNPDAILNYCMEVSPNRNGFLGIADTLVKLAEEWRENIPFNSEKDILTTTSAPRIITYCGRQIIEEPLTSVELMRLRNLRER